MKSIFDLHKSVLSDYCDFVRSFLLIADRLFLEINLGQMTFQGAPV